MMRDFVYQALKLVSQFSLYSCTHDKTVRAELLGFDGVVAEVSVAHILTLMLF